MSTHFFLLLLSITLPGLGLLVHPGLTKEIFRDLRLLRILHYVALAILGLSLYSNKTGEMTFFLQQKKILALALFIVVLIYAAVFAIVTNNIEDLEADKITNPARPLVQGKVDQRLYLLSGILCLLYSFVLAWLVQPEMFYGIFTISAGYFIYSCKPFRLKRIPFLSKLIIGFNSLVVCTCGFILAGGQVKEFPLIWALFILLPLSLTANFIDLKDTAGDSRTGIKTLPVIFGELIAKRLIVLFTVSTYAMAAVIVNIIWLYPLSALMAALHCFLIYRKPYNEKPVFLIYLSALFGLSVILMFHKYLLPS